MATSPAPVVAAVLWCQLAIAAAAHSGLGVGTGVTMATALVPPAGATVTVFPASAALAGSNSTSTVAGLSGSWAGAGPVSAEYLAVLTAPATAQMTFNCSVANGAVRFWLDDHLLCDAQSGSASATMAGGPARSATPRGQAGQDTAPLPPFVALSKGQRYFLRLQFAHNASSATAASVGLAWATATPGAPLPPPAAHFGPIPTAVLSPPPVDHPQLSRIRMQRDMATGCKDLPLVLRQTKISLT